MIVCAFDFNFLGKNVKSTNHNVDILLRTNKKIDPEINKDKTTYMSFQRTKISSSVKTVYDKSFEKFNSFRYLGMTVTLLISLMM